MSSVVFVLCFTIILIRFDKNPVENFEGVLLIMAFIVAMAFDAGSVLLR